MRRMLLTGRTIRLTGDDGTMADRLVAHGATLDDDGAVAVHVVSVSTVEQPLAESARALEASVREQATGELQVVHSVFRPVPLTPVSGRRIF